MQNFAVLYNKKTVARNASSIQEKKDCIHSSPMVQYGSEHLFRTVSHQKQRSKKLLLMNQTWELFLFLLSLSTGTIFSSRSSTNGQRDRSALINAPLEEKTKALNEKARQTQQRPKRSCRTNQKRRLRSSHLKYNRSFENHMR